MPYQPETPKAAALPWRTAGGERGHLLVVAIATAMVVALFYWPVWSFGDDTIILAEAAQYGLGVLLVPYHAYLILIHRAVTLIQGPDPLIIGALGSYAAVAFVAWFLARRVHPITVLALILAPALSVYGTLSNIQWVLAVYLIGMLVASPPMSARGRVADVAGIFLVGLTGPFSILLIPLYAVRAINRAWRWHAVAVAVAAAIQVGFLLTSTRHSAALGHDVLAVMVARDAIPILLIVLAGWRLPRPWVLGALYIAYVVPVLGIMATLHTTGELLAGDGQRYFYLPWVIAIGMVLTYARFTWRSRRPG